MGTPGDVKEDADADERDDEARSAVGHERKRDSGQRREPCASRHGSRKLNTRARRYGSIHTATRPTALMIAKPVASVGSGVPETSSTAATITASVIAVPRSGSSRISSEKSASSAPIG